MSRPNESPSWCDDDAASKVVEPSGVKKLAGFKYLERPAMQYFNWLIRNFVKWILHLDVSVNHFDPHEAATPDMTIVLSAGKIQSGITLTSVSEQTTASFVAPAGNPRIDRIVIDNVTGAYSVIAGTEAASPVAPDLTEGKIAICQILLDNSPATTEITNDLITDERASIPQPPILKTKIIEIGDWDMDAGNKSVSHGLTLSKIRSMTVTIRNDTDTQYYDFGSNLLNTETSNSGINVGSTAFSLVRAAGGTFDNINFDSTSYNRGWIIVQYAN